MTRTTNARLAGFMFLFYIAISLPSTILFEQATSAEGIPATFRVPRKSLSSLVTARYSSMRSYLAHGCC